MRSEIRQAQKNRVPQIIQLMEEVDDDQGLGERLERCYFTGRVSQKMKHF